MKSRQNKTFNLYSLEVSNGSASGFYGLFDTRFRMNNVKIISKAL